MKDRSKAPGAPREGAVSNGGSPQEAGQPWETFPAPFRPNGHPPRARLDIWVALDLLVQRWHWLVLGTCISAAAFYLVGLYVLKPKFTASAQLLRYDALGISDQLKGTPISGDTLAGMIRSPDLLRRVGAQVFPPIPPETLTKLIKVDPDPDSDLVAVQLAAREPRLAVELLNLYLTNAVQFTRELQAQQAASLANQYLKKEVGEMDHDIADLQEQFRKMPLGLEATDTLAQMGHQVSAVGTNLASTARPSMLGFTQQAERLQKALAALDELRLKYTDLHPLVQQQQSIVNGLRQEMAEAATNHNALAFGWAGAAGPNSALSPELDIVQIKLRALEDSRVDLAKRQREASLYATDPPGNLKVWVPADLKTVKASMRGLKISLVTIFGAGLGLGASLVLVFLVEFVDPRLKTAGDVARVTGLPVFTALGDLGEMSSHERAQWAFRAWTQLQGRLSPSPNYGLVCGVTSSSPGEGRSTWISLLAEAASLTGFRVLTIATRPSPTRVPSTGSEGDGAEAALEVDSSVHSTQALTSSVLAAPAQVTAQLTAPNSQPVVHIPLPGWVWNLERRKQWREALHHWSQIDNLVIFVELPPAGVPEAVLLGSNLPNVLWLAQSGAATARETRAQLETLRHARCQLVGALFNRQAATPLRQLFPRWLSCLVLVGVLAARTVQAQETPPAAPGRPTASAPGAPEVETQTNLSFSIVDPSQRAPWERRLTLGPGDVLNFGLYGQPELALPEVAIGPDGRVGYLEAQDVLATGLTIDELRASFDHELAKYRRAPHTIITPVAYKSKKYFMLGKVTTKGVFTLDRPMTVLEALARAHGFETALVDRSIVSLTDFQRSFIARDGKRIPLDFERLFQQGDLSQNIAVEPGDYIYFAPGDVPEVYVVGEVRLPGPVTYSPNLTIIGALTQRGGYTERAFKARVLVIRGSLANPEKFAVNTHAILDAKEPDFKLRPRDIIYVNSRPFIKVEELADLATTAFIQSVVTSWVGVDVLPPF